MNKQQEEFVKRVQEYQREDIRIMKKFKIEKKLIINHPTKQKANFIASQLIKLLGRMGYVIDTRYRNLKK